MPRQITISRIRLLFAGVISFAIVALAVWLQIKYALEPCPLCIVQRLLFLLLGIAFWLGIYSRYAVWLQLVSALMGMAVAGWHIWIQATHHAGGDCGVGMTYLFANFPLHKALLLLLRGTGDCGLVNWTWWGITLPQMSFLAFLVLGMYALWQHRQA